MAANPSRCKTARRRGTAVLCQLLLAFATSGSLLSDQPRTLAEYELKSLYLYRICKFTEWSGDLPPDGTFEIVVLGKLSAGGEIRIPAGKTIGGRQVSVRAASTADQIGTCQVLYIAGSEAEKLEEILLVVRDKAVLTVGDTPGFGSRGIIINFLIEDGVLKYEINPAAEKISGVKLNSQLYAMSVARVVK